jgi:HEAT repeats
MIDDKLAAHLLDYLDGNLTVAEKEVLEMELLQNLDLQEALAQMRVLQVELAEIPEQTPSNLMEERFRLFIQVEKQKVKAEKPGFLKELRMEWIAGIAAAVVLIGIGFGWLWRINQQQQSQIAALSSAMDKTQKMLVLAVLQEPSASERIQAVNVLEREKADPQIIQALVQTLNTDDMVNVRMKAAQALSSFSYDHSARQALIKSLMIQDSPEVQITIIELLVAIGEKKAAPSLRTLSEDPALLEVVRERAERGLEVLL